MVHIEAQKVKVLRANQKNAKKTHATLRGFRARGSGFGDGFEFPPKEEHSSETRCQGHTPVWLRLRSDKLLVAAC